MSPLEHPSWGGSRPGSGRKPVPKPSDTYSLVRAINDVLEHGGPSSGLEAELHFEEERRREKMPALSFLTGAQRAGVVSIHLPSSLRVVSVGEGGGALVPEEKPPTYINLLTWSVCRQAGAQVLDGLTGGNLSLAQETALPPVSWQPELGFSPEVEPTFAGMQLEPKRVTGTVRCSRQLLIQGGPNLDNWLLNSLSRACSSQLDYVCLFGDPGANPNMPRGIIHTNGIHRIEPGDTAELYDVLNEFEQKIAEENVSLDTYAHVTSPAVKRFFKGLAA